MAQREFLNPNHIVGKNLNDIRTDQEPPMSQWELIAIMNRFLARCGAIRLPAEQSAISRIEAGERKFTYIEAIAASYALRCSLDAFWTGRYNYRPTDTMHRLATHQYWAQLYAYQVLPKRCMERGEPERNDDAEILRSLIVLLDANLEQVEPYGRDYQAILRVRNILYQIKEEVSHAEGNESEEAETASLTA